MKIIKLVSEHFKRLQAVSIEPNNNIVKITGKNRQGKTSVLDSIWAALGGDKAAPQQPIHNGEKKAKITLDLGEFSVTRIFTPGGSRIEITNPSGFTAKSPQKILDGLLGKFTFDPLNFMRLKEKEQYDQMMSLVTIKLDKDKLLSIVANVGTSDLLAICRSTVNSVSSPLDVIKSVRDLVYSWRSNINLRIKSLTGAIDNIELPENHINLKRVNVSELMDKREGFVKIIDENKIVRNNLDEKCEELTEAVNDLFSLTRQKEDLLEKLKTVTEMLENETARKIEIENEISGLEEEVETLIDPDLSSIDEKIRNADQINRSVEMIEKKEKLVREKELTELDADKGTQTLKDIDSFKQKLLGDTKFPVEGLTVDEGVLMYNGSPLSQASDAEQLLVSVKIAMALNPKIRVIRVRDGSLLDSDSFKILEKIANENDFQIWVEVVADEPGSGVYIVDGQISDQAGD